MEEQTDRIQHIIKSYKKDKVKIEKPRTAKIVLMTLQTGMLWSQSLPVSGVDQRWWQTGDLGAASGPRKGFSPPAGAVSRSYRFNRPRRLRGDCGLVMCLGGCQT